MNELAKDLAESLKTGILGMGITLMSLYVLSLLLDLMKVIFYKGENKQKTAALNEAVIQKETEKQDAEDEKELVAAITAVLATYLKKPQDQIKIGFIRRIQQKSSTWSVESRLNPIE